MNEELKAAMEEVQSTSEELQSTNEELETAKEELQSSNEELITLNDELKNRNQTISILNADLVNVSENVDSAVVLIDGDLKIRLFNPAAEKILNLVPGQIGLPITSVNMGIVVEELKKTVLESIANNSKITKQIRDKEERMFELRVRPYFIEKGRIDGAVLTFIDIADLKKYEEQLRSEEEKYRTLGENSPDVIVRFDKNLRYSYTNSVIEEVTGLPPEAFIGKTNRDIGLPEKPLESLTTAVKKAFKTGEKSKDEFEFSTPKGTRTYQSIVVPEFFANGSAKTVISILRDVTDKKEMEKAQRLAAIGATAGMVGHDIRNPLQAITGDIYLLNADLASCLDGEEKKSALESLKEIEKNIDYINKIVADLQDFARPLNPTMRKLT